MTPLHVMLSNWSIDVDPPAMLGGEELPFVKLRHQRRLTSRLLLKEPRCTVASLEILIPALIVVVYEGLAPIVG